MLEIEPNNIAPIDFDYTSLFSTNEVFNDRYAIERWVKAVGLAHNIVIIVHRSHPPTERKLGRLQLTCERYGDYRSNKKKGGDQKKQRKTRTKKCNCSFMVMALETRRDNWSVFVKSGKHNHLLDVCLIGHPYVGRPT